MKKWYNVFATLFLSQCFLACTIQPIILPLVPDTPQLPVRRQSAEVVPDEQGRHSGTYFIRALDPLVIMLTGIPEEQRLEVVVDESGKITLPLLGPVIAAGQTPSELSRNVERAYTEKQFYRKIFVNIAMPAKSYYVQGEVNVPGQYPLTSGTTLMQALATARGLSLYAGHKVEITRNGQIYKYDIKKIERNPIQDVEIEADDLIRVLRSWF